MESKLSQQKNVMTSKIKPKPKISSSEKQNTWSNLLNKKSTSTNTVLESKNKSKKHSPIFNKNNKTISKGVQCDSIPINCDTKLCKNVDQISVFNPIRTLQFLLKEIKGLNIQDKSVKKIVDDMQIVVERIINEQLLENILFSKSHMPVTNENFMIPTRDNDNLKNLNCENNQLDNVNKYWLVLLRKISELENNYSQLTKNYTNSEEKLLCITSERNKLLEKFKESCDSLEELNNRERAYLDTIAELKTKLITSEKLISKQESIIINLNTKLNISQKKKEVIFTDLQNNEFNTNYNNTKLEINRIKDNEISKFRSDMRQMKKIVMTGLENNNNKFMSMKPESNSMKDFSKYSETRKIEDIDTQFIEFNKQASAIKSAKTELQQLFETIKTQTNLSKKQFNSTIINYETNINDIISDEEDNYSNLSNFTSIITDSSN